jgi:hypothetical protein
VRGAAAGDTIGAVTRFGIQDYDPLWVDGRSAVLAVHGARLGALAGLTLRHVWVVWDLEDDGWFADAPVLLDFGDRSLAVDHQKFDDISLTWDTVDPARPIEGTDFHLEWRPEALPALADLPGRVLRHVELLEWVGGRGDAATGSVALGFDLAPAWLTVYNAMDENGFEHDPPDGRYRRHRTAPPLG